MAGQVATLNEIQPACPPMPPWSPGSTSHPAGPNPGDPDGEHWGVVVRSRSIPAWVPIAGTGPDGLWTKDDTALAALVRTELQQQAGTAHRPAAFPREITHPALEPLAKALGATAAVLPPARRLIVLLPAMAGIPLEALHAPTTAGR